MIVCNINKSFYVAAVELMMEMLWLYTCDCECSSRDESTCWL